MVWFLPWEWDISPLLKIQSSSEAQLTSYSLHTLGSFPGCKADWASSWALTTMQWRG
jgi:hypothetical protein